MKISKMTIEGDGGRPVTLVPDFNPGWVRVEDAGVPAGQADLPREAGVWLFGIDATNEESLHYGAAKLQKLLDGYEGTAGDRVEYEMVIRQIAAH